MKQGWYFNCSDFAILEYNKETQQISNSLDSEVYEKAKYHVS